MRGGRPSLGRAGENWAAEHLRAQGYTILERNWHSRWGEMDIIAARGNIVAFVEVKTRKTGGLEGPLEAVSPSKQARLLLTAQSYLMLHPEEERQPRMDVCAILARQGVHTQKPEILYLENAFD